MPKPPAEPPIDLGRFCEQCGKFIPSNRTEHVHDVPRWKPLVYWITVCLMVAIGLVVASLLSYLRRGP